VSTRLSGWSVAAGGGRIWKEGMGAWRAVGKLGQLDHYGASLGMCSTTKLHSQPNYDAFKI
jgi:hypothetical protein